MDEHLYLTSATAVSLYEKFAGDLPIIDYHCHLSPREICEDRRFSNIGELWLAGDHYKWRAMRAFGIDEELITGGAPWFDKFCAFAAILPRLAGNPLYIWCALELKRYFGVEAPLCEDNARDIYDAASKTIEELGMSPSYIMRASNVEYVATTDDPADSLEYHRQIAQNPAYSGCRVVPAFRPDKAMGIEKPGFAKYIKTLGLAAGIKIKSFKKLIKALEARLEEFKAAGASLNDNAVTGFKWIDYTDEQVRQIFRKAARSDIDASGSGLTAIEINIYRSAFLFETAKLYAKHGFTAQYHIGAYRDANGAMYDRLGPDSGFDSVDEPASIRAFGKLFDRLAQCGALPRTILYPLDISQYEAFATLASNFCGKAPGWVQLGAPWWFNDQRYGIIKQFESVGSVYPAALSAGMLTDSRSFLSYPRHELYRRAFCDYLGAVVERGEYFSGEAALGEIIRDVCYRNAKKYFLETPAAKPAEEPLEAAEDPLKAAEDPLKAAEEPLKAAEAGGYCVYRDSVNKVDGCVLFIAAYNGEKSLLISGEGRPAALFAGERVTAEGAAFKVCPLTHDNISALRSLFDWVNPVCACARAGGAGNKNISVGLGDRLGLASAGHIRAIKSTGAFPILAQQSVRELNLTGRTFSQVLDDACAAVFQEGYRGGFGADGDHLKQITEVHEALACGYTMITLDCSEHIGDSFGSMQDDGVLAAFAALPDEKQAYYKSKYLDKVFCAGDLYISFTLGELARTVMIYDGAISHAEQAYREAIAVCGRDIDFEVSIDETQSATAPAAHFFFANELKDRDVPVSSLAPRFCGEFQKGIDYVGDPVEFERDFKAHAMIAKAFGYKISVHSGSDKFSVFPIIGRLADSNFHIKTAGTNWLEAVRVIAEKNPGLFRQIYAHAVSSLGEAKKYYHIDAGPENVPGADALGDGELPRLLGDANARQALHITYGQILQARAPDGGYIFRSEIYKLLADCEEDYYSALARHIGRHMELLAIE